MNTLKNLSNFILHILARADAFRADVAREKHLMETYGFTVITSGGSAKDGTLFATQKSGSTVALPSDKKEAEALVKEWKQLSARLKVVRAFQSQESIPLGHLRQVAEVLKDIADEAEKAEQAAKAAMEREATPPVDNAPTVAERNGKVKEKRALAS